MEMKPRAKPTAPAWKPSQGDAEATKKVSVDMPASLHRTLKLHCASHDLRMNSVIVELLMQKFAGGAGRG